MKIIKEVTGLSITKEPVLSLFTDHNTIDDELCITIIVTKKFKTLKDADNWWDTHKKDVETACDILDQTLNLK